MRITSRQLRQIIREELIREVENPGSALQSKLIKGRHNTVEDALRKTVVWFTNVVFPAAELDHWPVVADQDYAIEFVAGAADGRVDPEANKIYIKRGTTFSNVDEKKVSGSTGDIRRGLLSLLEMYKMLEDTVISFKLDVPMQSFPD